MGVNRRSRFKKKIIFFRVIFMDVPIRDRRIQGCYHVISPLINPVDERGHFTVDDVTDVPSKLKLVMSIDGGGDVDSCCR